MNPEKPSREEIEARITALLLGELPADEAALLRWTISQDAALKKLHDELQSTIVLVRETKKNPADAATVDSAPLKLSDERRQKLLVHFKTPRPRESFWIRRLEIPALIPVLAIVSIIVLLAAMMLPALSKAKNRALKAPAANPARQETFAFKSQMQLAENQPVPTSAAAKSTTITVAPAPVVAPPPAPIVLPPTEAPANVATGSLAAPGNGGVYSQNIVGYVDIPITNGLNLVATTPADSLAFQSTDAIQPATSDMRQADTLVQDAKLLYEMGKLKESEAKLDQAVKLNPDNSNAYYYINLDKQAAYTHALAENTHTVDTQTRMEQVEKQWKLPVDSGDISGFTGNVGTANAFTGTPSSQTTISGGVIAGAGTVQQLNGVTTPLDQFAVTNIDLIANDFSPGKDDKPGMPTAPGQNHSALAWDDSSANRLRVENNQASPPAATSVQKEMGIRYTYGLYAYHEETSNPEGAFPGEGQIELKPAGKKSDAGNEITPLPGTSTADQQNLSDVAVNTAANSSPAQDRDVTKVPLVGDVPLMGQLFQGSTSTGLGPIAAPAMPPGTSLANDKNAEQNAQVFKMNNSDPSETVRMLESNANSSSQSSTVEPTLISRGGEMAFTNSGTVVGMINAFGDAGALRNPSPAPVPQPEILTRENNFSTFSLNVSEVSFQLAAASLEKGLLPEAASIRSEEFINAFDYRDPEAAAGQPMAFTSERAHYPFAQNRDLLRFSIKTAAAGRPTGRALNIVLLLDVSGSMERADRVAIIREALRVLAGQLQPQDTVSVVTFARTARLWADGIPGDQAGETFEKVGGITPEGGTNLEEAMRLAYETARRHYLAKGMNRVVMLTDGAANLGNVDLTVLKQTVEAQRKQGIALDCFGIGFDGYDDDLMEQLSRNGDGRYAFINSPDDAGKEFATKLAGALQVAASDVKVQVEFNPDRVISYRQIGYAKHQLTKQQFRDNTVLAAEIAAQEAGNALYTIETKPDGTGPIATVHVRYRIPGTTDYQEHSWDVAYKGKVPALEQSSAAMRLAATAGAFSEWLAASPFAQEVSPDALLNDLSGVPGIYGADERPKKLEWMIRQAKSLSGK